LYSVALVPGHRQLVVIGSSAIPPSPTSTMIEAVFAVGCGVSLAVDVDEGNVTGAAVA
jgi:hypothetical protein